jgi:hypothetical protein
MHAAHIQHAVVIPNKLATPCVIHALCHARENDQIAPCFCASWPACAHMPAQ